MSKVVITTVAGLSLGDILSLYPTGNQWLLRVIISAEPWQTPVPSDKSTHIIITEGEVEKSSLFCPVNCDDRFLMFAVCPLVDFGWVAVW